MSEFGGSFLIQDIYINGGILETIKRDRDTSTIIEKYVLAYIGYKMYLACKFQFTIN